MTRIEDEVSYELAGMEAARSGSTARKLVAILVLLLDPPMSCKFLEPRLSNSQVSLYNSTTSLKLRNITQHLRLVLEISSGKCGLQHKFSAAGLCSLYKVVDISDGLGGVETRG